MYWRRVSPVGYYSPSWWHFVSARLCSRTWPTSSLHEGSYVWSNPVYPGGICWSFHHVSNFCNVNRLCGHWVVEVLYCTYSYRSPVSKVLDQYMSALSETVALCVRVAKVVSPVVCNSSPEGFLPDTKSLDKFGVPEVRWWFNNYIYTVKTKSLF